jgi:phosphoserine phosphatase RsbU/P
VFPDWKYEDSEIVLKSGDLLLLFTDGITEAMAADGEEFGEDRLIAAASSPRQSIDALQSQVLGQVKKFCNSRMNDDATLILVAAPCTGPEEKNLALNRNRSEEHRQYVGAQP